MTHPHRSILIASLSLVASVASAQSRDSARVDKTFLTRRDLAWTGVALAGSAAISVFDAHDLFDNFSVVNEQPMTLGALAVYGVGRLAGSDAIASLGLHATEALVLTVAASELIRGPVGRARPRVSRDDAYDFSFGKGFTDFSRRSFPSIHSAVGFATASVIVGELKQRHPSTVPYAAPVLYAAALVPGGINRPSEMSTL